MGRSNSVARSADVMITALPKPPSYQELQSRSRRGDAIIGEEKDLRRTPRRFDSSTFARWVLLVLMLAMMGTGLCAISQFNQAAYEIKRRRDGDAAPPPARPVEKPAPPSREQ